MKFGDFLDSPNSLFSFQSTHGSMRFRRLFTLLVIVILACLSIAFLRKQRVTPPDDIFTPPSFQFPQTQTENPDHPPTTYLRETHPIALLIQNAEREFETVRVRQSRTLAKAVDEYQRRYKMRPPPHFDKWFEFAQQRGVQLIDEYDTIYDCLLPFWAIEPQVLRARARETIGFDNAIIGLSIRDGKVSLVDGGGDGHKWQREATKGMMKQFVQYLPDMDLVFNTHDEPRVILPSEDLARLVSIAKNQVIPAAFQNPSPLTKWSSRPDDLNKGDRIDSVQTTRFNRFAHQSTWTNSRMSCPVDSPARSLDEFPTDLESPYALGDLGFISNKTAFSDICNTPSLRYTFGFFDRPNAFDVVHDLFPVFSQSKISSFQDILYPSPWYWVDQVPYQKDKDVRWEDKQDKMYWRGSTTGGFSRAGGWRRQHRQLLVKTINASDKAKILERDGNGNWSMKEVLRRDYSELFDVRFTLIGQCDPDDCRAQEEFFEVVQAAGQQDAWAYKHLVDIDGNAFSGRYYAFLQSNSMVYKVSIFREWHEEWLKPWVHYVPLSLKGTEYVESVRYFTLDEEGKSAARQLAMQGQSWAQAALRHEDLEVWFFRLLLEYGRLVDDGRDKLGFVL